MKVLITGGTGFIGLRLIKELKSQGHEVLGLTRNIEQAQRKDTDVIWIPWKSHNEIIDFTPYGKIDAIINLVGENLANKRWSNEQKKVIYNSRVEATRNLCKSIKESQGKIDTFISTSAIGIYGNRRNEEIHEKSLIVDDFVGSLCRDWEEAVTSNSDIYNRSVIIRVGLVLGKNGGMMEKLLPLFNLGLGGKLSHGNQYMSWIHLDDICRIFIKALNDHKMEGVYNGTAPFPVTNKEFTNTLGRTIRKSTFFSVPRFALKVVMGEMAEHVLSGAKIIPKRLKEDNFHFLFPTVEVAIKDVVSKEKSS